MGLRIPSICLHKKLSQLQLDLDIMMIDILTKVHERWIKTLPLECTQGFSKI